MSNIMSKRMISALAAAGLVTVAFAQDGQRTVYDLPGDALHPEGIAFDQASNSLFVSGAGTGEILRIDRESGEVTSFVPSSGVPFSVLGLEVDAEGRLWAAGASTGEIRAYNIEDGTQVFNAATGEGGLLNDLTVSSTGDVYVTDSDRPVIFKISAGSEEAEEWLNWNDGGMDYSEGGNANGIVITDDDAHLIVAQLRTGQLWLVDTATKDVTEIDAGETFPGADGIVLDGHTLYVIQNSANHVSVVELDEGLASGSVTGTLTADTFGMPATGVLLDGELVVVNTQFNALGGEPELPFVLSVVDVAE